MAHQGPTGVRGGGLGRLVDARPGEGRSILWATLYFFCLMAAYFSVRSLREALGLAGGVDKLPWVWTGTLLAALAATPLFAMIVARLPRRRFVPIVYRAAVACLLLFWLAFQVVPTAWELVPAYAFYIWLSVFNLFAVAVFWGFQADLFRLEQAKRLFPFIAVGGTTGAIAGAQIAQRLAQPLGSFQLLLVAAVLLECASQCVHRLVRLHGVDTPRERVTAAQDTPTAGIWSGARLVFQRPYLLGICAFMLFHALFNTILYFQQASIVDRAIPAGDARTEVFATIDTWSQVLTLVLQLFVSGRLIAWLGVTFALITQPAVAALGCALVGFALWKGPELAAGGWSHAWPPDLWAIVLAMIAVRAANFATARPARESLYTVVEREVKYKSKSFVDTVVYRLGDAIGMWGSRLLGALGVGLASIAIGAVPLAFVWLAVGRMLGRQQRALAREQGEPD